MLLRISVGTYLLQGKDKPCRGFYVACLQHHKVML